MLNRCTRCGDGTFRGWRCLIPVRLRGARNFGLATVEPWRCCKIKRIRRSLDVSFRAFPDNQQLTKHVESTFVSCLDAGSTPASSTSDGDTDLPSAASSTMPLDVFPHVQWYWNHQRAGLGRSVQHWIPPRTASPDYLGQNLSAATVFPIETYQILA